MSLRDAVAQAFAQEGLLARSHVQYVPRAGQISMARAVAETLEESGQLVVEAGTGIGKTFAYLVPVLLSGHRTLVCTATKALQDQLALRDIPHLLTVLKMQARVAVLKGRTSYVCLNRLASARLHSDAAGSENQLHLAQLERWVAQTRSGDMAEMQDWPDQSVLEPMVTSTRENCLGAECPQTATCFVNQARAAAMSADIVVANHHLFFADLNVRESGVAELLPQMHAVVFDEAHQLNDIGVQFLGRQWSTRQVQSTCKELDKHSATLALGAADWRSWVSDALQATGDLKMLCADLRAGQSLPWSEGGPQGMSETLWHDHVASVARPLQLLLALLHMLQESEPNLRPLTQRMHRCLDELSFFCAPVMPGYTRWLECGAHLKMCCSPLDIGETLAAHMGLLAHPLGAQRAWIFTSATLGVDADLALFRNACGLHGARVITVGSPYDYGTQAALFIPAEFPLPTDSLHSIQVAHLAAQASLMLGGRTMVLTTSLRAMHAIGDALRRQFFVAGGPDVLVQGQLSKREILTRFNDAVGPGQTGCVLVASASFWEGVDIPGESLQLLIIDKIPFLSPDGALTQAREAQARSRGQNPFRDFHLPHAALALKQGAGRLIRSESDRGVLVVCDPRLLAKSYGKKILAALPPMRRLDSPDDFQAELRALTKPSTMDLCWT